MSKDNIIFNISYDENGKIIAKINEESKRNLDPKTQETNEVLGATLISTTLETLEQSTKAAFKHMGATFPAKAHILKVTTMSFGLDYLLYLDAETQKYGDNGLKNHAVALSQAIVGRGFATVGGVVGGAAGFAIPVPGSTFALSISGTVSASVFYEEKNINGKPINEWIGDFVRNVIPEEKEFYGSETKHNPVDTNNWSYQLNDEYTKALFSPENLEYNFKTAYENNIPYGKLQSLNIWQKNYNFQEGTPFKVYDAPNTYPNAFEQAAKDYFEGRMPKSAFYGGDGYKESSDSNYTPPQEESNKSKESFSMPKSTTYSSDSTSYSSNDNKKTSEQSTYFTPPSQSKVHETKQGDTIWKIAKDHGMSVDDLLKVKGNEYLQQFRYKDNFGMDNII